MRTISLVPSATETLVALGAEVVACTRFCEQPDLPHVGGTKNPDIAAIVASAPDLVVVDEEENRREDAEALAHAGLRLLVTAVRSVDDALAVVAELAEAAGVAWDGPPPTVGRGSEASSVVRAPRPAGGLARRVFVPIWRRPWMSINADTYGASVLAAAGIDVVTAEAPERYPVVDLDDVVALEPTMVLVPSEPYTFTDAHIGDLATRFDRVPVRRVDGRDLFWWGVRTPGALDRFRSVRTLS